MRRAARTWLLASLSCGAGWAAFLLCHYGALQHVGKGDLSGNIVPARFLMAGYGACFLLTLLAGVVFLAFDHQARNQAAGVAEALDARPVSNVAVFAGRLLALVAVMWLVCVAFAFGMQAAGLAADHWLRPGLPDSWLGPVEPWSLVAFLFVDAPPALVVWGGLVLLLAAALRNRPLVAVVGLALLCVYGWLLLFAPLRFLPAFSILSGLDGFASDMLPRALTRESGALRAGQLLLGTGFLALGAAMHTRVESRAKVPKWFLGCVFTLAGGLVVALLMANQLAGRHQREAWLAAHTAQRDAPRAEVPRISANVTIDAGEALHVDATLDLVLPPEPNETLVFSLNPGLRVRTLELNGQAAPFRHEDGLLLIPAGDAPAASEATLRVVAGGAPNPEFAYLDSIVDPLALGVADGHHRILGTEPMVFSEHYAVLLPAIGWLPSAGANLDDHDTQFHALQLRVDVPDGWHAVAPGKREAIASPAGRRIYTFRTASRVPMPGLLAGRFKRYAAKSAGLELELLVHPGHQRNADFFKDDARMLLEMFLGQRVARARMAGLRFPQRRFSFVEVPGRLRGFGGGWKLDTSLALPGAALLREYGLPSMRMGMPAFLMVHFFMAADLSGGDPNIALWRNLTRFQTRAAGLHATLLDFLLEELAKGSGGSYWASAFSAHHYAAASEGAIPVLPQLFGYGVAVDREIKAAAGHAATSADYLNVSLGDLRFAGDAKRLLELMNFKGRMLERTLSHGWGPNGGAKVLREVLRRHGGGVYTLDDLRAAAQAVGAPLDAVIGQWWASSDLPGFVASPLNVYRLDDDDGEPRYQLRLHVCNDEAAPGLVRLAVRGDDALELAFSSAHRVAPLACVEIGLVAEFPPASATLDTYLSKNGADLRLPLPAFSTATALAAAPLQGARASAWRPPQSDAIVVDDLSPGFAVDDAAAPRGLLLRRRKDDWERRETPGSWGKYARTAVWFAPGEGRRAATFTARLPAPGRWRLHYHLPGTEVAELGGSVAMSVRHARASHKVGSFEMTLVEQRGAPHGVAPDERRTVIEFDGGIGEAGWNHLGDFDLTSTNVSLVVTDRTDGDVVVADAIRWHPLGG